MGLVESTYTKKIGKIEYLIRDIQHRRAVMDEIMEKLLFDLMINGNRFQKESNGK